MIYETEVLGRSVSAANRRADLLNLTRDARALRSNHVAGALLTSLDDRLLSDIGIQRADIPAISDAAASRSFAGSRMHAAGTLTRGI